MEGYLQQFRCRLRPDWRAAPGREPRPERCPCHRLARRESLACLVEAHGHVLGTCTSNARMYDQTVNALRSWEAAKICTLCVRPRRQHGQHASKINVLGRTSAREELSCPHSATHGPMQPPPAHCRGNSIPSEGGCPLMRQRRGDSPPCGGMGRPKQAGAPHCAHPASWARAQPRGPREGWTTEKASGTLARGRHSRSTR